MRTASRSARAAAGCWKAEYMAYALIALCALTDQITKFFISGWLAPNGSFPIFEGVLHLSYHENTGAAWGILQDARWVFLVFSTVAILAILAYLILAKTKPRGIPFALALICGGGIGNMIDRIRLGYVVDFVDVRLINFPLFNVADACVCVGTFLFVILYLRDEFRKKKQSAGNADV